jgi:nucleotide-binding universal stress UspA family protein
VTAPPRAIRRVLVAGDLSAPGLAAIATGACLARRTGATLEGLFVVDEDVVRLPDLVAARFVSVGSEATPRPDAAAMERAARSEADRVRQRFLAAASAAGVEASFRALRGKVPRRVVEASRDADLLVLGRAGRAPGRRGAPGSTARAAAAGATDALILPAGRDRLGDVLVVPPTAPDARSSFHRVLDLALALAGEARVLVLREGPRAAEAQARLAARGARAILVPRARGGSLGDAWTRTARRELAGVVVCARDEAGGPDGPAGLLEEIAEAVALAGA